jgi:AAA family ATP:ADP antiporter
MKTIAVTRAELRQVVASFLAFFFLLTSTSLLRPVREEMGIAGGAERLPWLFTATFLVTLVVTPVFGTIVSRLPRRRIALVSYRTAVVCLLAFFAALHAGLPRIAVGKAFFVWLSVYNLFVVSVFWSLMVDTFSAEQAKRLFGLIAAGGTAGAIAGPLITHALVSLLGATNLFLVAALFLEVAVHSVRRVSASAAWREVPGQVRDRDAPVGGSPLAGLRHIARSSYLLGICLVLLFFTATSTFVYLEQAHILQRTTMDPAERTRFFAKCDIAVNVATLLLQLLCTGGLLRRVGLFAGLALVPVLTAAGMWVLAASPTLWVVATVQALRRAAHYAIDRPAREILFTGVPAEDRYKSKNFIDTFVYRGGDAASAWLDSALRTVGLGLTTVALVAFAIAACWVVVVARLARSFDRRRATQTRMTVAAERVRASS